MGGKKTPGHQYTRPDNFFGSMALCFICTTSEKPPITVYKSALAINVPGTNLAFNPRSHPSATPPTQQISLTARDELPQATLGSQTTSGHQRIQAVSPNLTPAPGRSRPTSDPAYRVAQTQPPRRCRVATRPTVPHSRQNHRSLTPPGRQRPWHRRQCAANVRGTANTRDSCGSPRPQGRKRSQTTNAPGFPVGRNYTLAVNAAKLVKFKYFSKIVKSQIL